MEMERTLMQEMANSMNSPEAAAAGLGPAPAAPDGSLREASLEWPLGMAFRPGPNGIALVSSVQPGGHADARGFKGADLVIRVDDLRPSGDAGTLRYSDVKTYLEGHCTITAPSLYHHTISCSILDV